ncbi:tetratricopeptide repeat protein [Chryseobacterium formosus]|uniref:Tetratricopeptide repeat protein n=1 Tax=Chryseobacterium formosus TaxID=1537363 RepID=A0ABT3XT60_9FLAO|nr:tetratricopeptide repeat protein [Chryseobacterium formosus]MCX8524472.1 tetratricopeptide repeat protein [Chryseobacterium formosus]
MIKTITILSAILFSSMIFSQKSDEKKLIKELSDNACKCIDSISASNKEKSAVVNEIHDCIDKQAGVLQLSSLLSSAEKMKENAPEVNGKKQINIEFNTNKNSEQYRESYNKIERTLMNDCEHLKKIINTAETKDNKFSDNEDAIEYYTKAVNFSKQEDWNGAIKNYKLALEKDPKFVYAWDNLGICYRRIGDYDKAIDAYKKSVAIDPTGKMPLQNIAIAYIYKKEYQKAIDAYLDLDKVHPNDAEVYYGVGQIYALHLENNEKGLDYISKAYKIYTQQKSPYRTDAEKIIGIIYNKMKEQNKLDKFKEILKKNDINFK